MEGKELTLDEVKNIRCSCGKSFPPAHMIPHKQNAANFTPVPDRFSPHDNKLCRPCIREELREMKAKGPSLTRSESKRMAALYKMMAIV